MVDRFLDINMQGSGFEGLATKLFGKKKSFVTNK